MHELAQARLVVPRQAGYTGHTTWLRPTCPFVHSQIVRWDGGRAPTASRQVSAGGAGTQAVIYRYMAGGRVDGTGQFQRANGVGSCVWQSGNAWARPAVGADQRRRP